MVATSQHHQGYFQVLSQHCETTSQPLVFQEGHCLTGLWKTFGMAKLQFPDVAVEEAPEAPEAPQEAVGAGDDLAMEIGREINNEQTRVDLVPTYTFRCDIVKYCQGLFPHLPGEGC